MTVPVFAGGAGGAPLFGSLDYFSGTSISMGNADFGNYNTSVVAFALAMKFRSVSSTQTIISEDSASPPGVRLLLSGSSKRLSFSANTPNETANFQSTTTLSADIWYSVLIHVDTANVTSGDRIKMWINGSAETPSSYTPPTTSLYTAGAPFAYGNSLSAQQFGGLLSQPSVISGSLPSTAAVFNGTKLNNLSGLTNLYSYIPAVDSVVHDDVLAADWTNNGGVILSDDIP